MDENTRKIRELNTQFWRDPQKHGKLFFTSSAAAKGMLFQIKVLRALKAYDAWVPDHDPYGERDMCVLEVDGQKVWAKLVLYEKGTGYEYGAEDPGNAETTDRVATIMLPEDY